MDGALLGQVKVAMWGRLLEWVTSYCIGGVEVKEVLAQENFENVVHIEHE